MLPVGHALKEYANHDLADFTELMLEYFEEFMHLRKNLLIDYFNYSHFSSPNMLYSDFKLSAKSCKALAKQLPAIIQHFQSIANKTSATKLKLTTKSEYAALGVFKIITAKPEVRNTFYATRVEISFGDNHLSIAAYK